MKVALVSLLFIAIAVVSVSATSPPNCAAVTCDPATCQVFRCRCGSYKDYCGCCDICHTCPGEECTILFRDSCTDGYNCTLDNPERSFLTGGSGHCRSPNETIEGHDNVDGHPEIHSFI
ncbi:single insulin-like growth factor-binding domain protein-2 [Dermacentor silvarum]|uniref:single insulin-like growth factor-binding domain protein-2 n=1 Tax=Dermacentor silvarum TaxID=543639 RepID=UPI001898A496|nr:single insulin-like growth factor-binding domain protein-2 [Dermacentor silvarum]